MRLLSHLLSVVIVWGPIGAAAAQNAQECRGAFAGPGFQRWGNQASNRPLNEVLANKQLSDQQLFDIFRADLILVMRKVDPNLASDAESVTFKEAVNCFPGFKMAIASSALKRESANRQEYFRRRQFEQAELERQAEKERSDKAKRPEFVLGRAYTQYILVKKCHDAREGYASMFVSDPELERAKISVKSIEDKIKGATPDIDTNVVWSAAGSVANSQQFIDREVCQRSLSNLLQSKHNIAPGSEAPIKDF